MNFCRWILTCLFYSKDKPMSTSCKGLLSQHYLNTIRKGGFDSAIFVWMGWLLALSKVHIFPKIFLLSYVRQTTACVCRTLPPPPWWMDQWRVPSAYWMGLNPSESCVLTGHNLQAGRPHQSCIHMPGGGYTRIHFYIILYRQVH